MTEDVPSSEEHKTPLEERLRDHIRKRLSAEERGEKAELSQRLHAELGLALNWLSKYLSLKEPRHPDLDTAVFLANYFSLSSEQLTGLRALPPDPTPHDIAMAKVSKALQRVRDQKKALDLILQTLETLAPEQQRETPAPSPAEAPEPSEIVGQRPRRVRRA
jgi:hypothetical protein